MWCHTSENLRSMSFSDWPRPRFLNSGVSSQLSNRRLSWSYSDMRYNLKKLLRAISVTLCCVCCQQGAQKREERSYAKWRRKKKIILQMGCFTIFVYIIFGRVTKEWVVTGFSLRNHKHCALELSTVILNALLHKMLNYLKGMKLCLFWNEYSDVFFGQC